MGQPNTTYRVLLVDDHATVRRGLAALLNAAPDVRVVGEAADGETALTLVADLRPDVVLMDVRMPGMGGVEATRRIVRDRPGVRVVGMSMDGEAAARRMLAAGAVVFVPKEADAGAFLKAIRARRSPTTLTKE